jgi:hypothetical protein
MKSVGIYPFLLFTLISFHCLAVNQQGKILKVKPDVYQIDYPNQIINIYFNYNPDEIFDHLVSGIQVTTERQEDIVRMIRDEIDQLPEDFIGKFLGIEIFPMHILAGETMGYYSAGKIVLEISQQKLSSAHDNTIQENYLHEVAHHIYKQMEFREETIAMIDFLKNNRNQGTSGYIQHDNYMQYGYISYYSTGGSSREYDPEEEFAEIFARLVSADSRVEILNYVAEHHGSLLAEKVTRFRSYLTNVIPSLNDEFFGIGKSTPPPVYTESGNSSHDYLALHEQKSNESYPIGEDEAIPENEKEESGVIDYPVTMLTESPPSNTTTPDPPYFHQNSDAYTSAFSADLISTKNRGRQSTKNKSKNKKLKVWGLGILTLGATLVATHYLNESLQSTIDNNGWTNRVNSKP